MHLLIRLRLKKLSKRRKIIFKISNRFSIGVVIINPQTTSEIDMRKNDSLSLQLLLYFIYLQAKTSENPHISYLRTDMKVQTDQFYIRQLPTLLYHML